MHFKNTANDFARWEKTKDLVDQLIDVILNYRQSAAYRDQVIAPGDRLDSTVVTTQARRLMHEWIFNPLAEKYAVSSDWDDRWRTGGTLDEVLDEARLTPQWLLKGIQRFAGERESRLQRLRAELASLDL